MDVRRKMFIISEESVDTCFMLNDHVCGFAMDGKCPHIKCSNAYEKAALTALKDIERKSQ